MSTIYGYVRNIIVDGDKCRVIKPNLFYKYLGETHEIHVEVDGLCKELIDCLVCFSKPMSKTKTSTAVLDRVIPVQELHAIYDSMMETDFLENPQACCQMKDIVAQCNAIMTLAGYDNKTAYFEFAISRC